MKPMMLIIFPFCFISCSVWTGLDPAESLAKRLEIEAKRLEKSETKAISFEFTPSETRLRESPFSDGRAVLAVYPDKKETTISVIQFNRWFVTTYHSRSVTVYSKLEMAHAYGTPFRIFLGKQNGKVIWTGIE